MCYTVSELWRLWHHVLMIQIFLDHVFDPAQNILAATPSSSHLSSRCPEETLKSEHFFLFIPPGKKCHFSFRNSFSLTEPQGNSVAGKCSHERTQTKMERWRSLSIYLQFSSYCNAGLFLNISVTKQNHRGQNVFMSDICAADISQNW